VLPEVVATVGSIPIADYGTPSTPELAESLTPHFAKHEAILLANHGAVTFAPTLFAAQNRMETIEQFAKILFVARTLGRVNLLSPEQVAGLNEIRHRYGLSGRAAECEACRNDRPFTDIDLAAARVTVGCAAPATPAPDPPAGPAPLTPPGGVAGRDDLVDRVVREVERILGRSG
jgi:L-fuculose-phosphate aldolase